MNSTDQAAERRKAKVEAMKGALERRTLTDGAELELRDGVDDFVVSGYAATFNQRYDLGSFFEQVSPSAFKRTLNEQPDCTFWVDHGRSLSGLPLARTRSKNGGPGSLTLDTDQHGLSFRAQLDREDPDAQALVRAIRSGRIWQCSFAFRCNNDSFDDETNTRTLLSVSLHGGDVSAVASPANPTTSIDARARADAQQRSLSVAALNRRDHEALVLLRAGIHRPPRPARSPAPDRRYMEDLARLAALRSDRNG